MSNMAGMYPVGRPSVDYPKEPQWPKNWTPVPIHTVPNKNDYVNIKFNFLLFFYIRLEI